MEKVIQEMPVNKNEGILQNEEGVHLIPANIELEALEISMIKCVNKEKILKQLALCGINEKYIYPGIDGIGRYINKKYLFKGNNM